ncbi:MAG TPA: bifunctional chorismate-binding protein/class IV aminotransferase [Pseudomonadales bacterium]
MPVHALIRDPDSPRWLRFESPRAVIAASRPDEAPAVLAAAEARARREGLYALGFVSYEAAAGFDRKLAVHPPGRLPPAWFALFPGFLPADAPAAGDVPWLDWQPDVDPAGYRRALARIHALIAAGDTYQVNFSYRLRAPLPADLPAASIFAGMIGRQPDALGVLLETDDWAICSASPELFFSRRGRCLLSRPMKGTAARGTSPEDDRQRAEGLQRGAKDRAENLMITDMVRNDIGRVAAFGSVRTGALFRLEAHPTLWQMTSTVAGATGASLARIFQAMFPAASITGAPKRRTMEVIRELETAPREIYTGALGLIRPNGDAGFNVAIRTAWLDKRRDVVEYGVGGGIVWDSDAEAELRETHTKAGILRGRLPAGFALLETLRWAPDGGFWFLPEHLARLQRAARCFYGNALDERPVRQRLDAFAATLAPAAHRVRLLVGPGGAVELSAQRLDGSPAPRRVVLARRGRPLSGNPFVRHKTTHRVLYDDARREAVAATPAADDVILVNERGEVTESTVANLVADLDGVLVTPPADAGLLPGVYRQHLLDTGRVAERRLRPADLYAARAVYLANSVRGLWPVELVKP